MDETRQFCEKRLSARYSRDDRSWASRRLHQELNTIPLNDEKTFEVLRSGNVEGIRQLEGLDAERLLFNLKPRSLTHLAVISAVTIGQVHEPGLLDEFVCRGIKWNIQGNSDSRGWIPRAAVVGTTLPGAGFHCPCQGKYEIFSGQIRKRSKYCSFQLLAPRRESSVR